MPAMTWKRPLLIYPYSPDKKSEQLYGGLAVINPIGLEVIATALRARLREADAPPLEVVP